MKYKWNTLSEDSDPHRADRIQPEDQAGLSSLQPQRELRGKGGTGHGLGPYRHIISNQPHGGRRQGHFHLDLSELLERRHRVCKTCILIIHSFLMSLKLHSHLHDWSGSSELWNPARRLWQSSQLS